MKVLEKKITLPKDINKLKGQLLYPKVVIIGNSNTIVVVDLEIKELSSSTKTYTFCHEIVQNKFDGCFLWVALKSSEVYVINLKKNSMLKLIVSNFANYKICGFESDKDKIILISTSGERLLYPCTKEELCAQFDSNVEEITVSLQKVPANYKLKPLQDLYKNGLQISVQNINIFLRCPVTGIIEKLITNKDLEFVVKWDDAAVLSTKQEMWLMDVTNFSKLLEFEKVESHYVPLGTDENTFYYLTWDTEVQVFSTSLKYNAKQYPQLEICSTPVEISQETLKAQLKSLVQEVIVADTNTVSAQLQNLFNDIQDSLFLIQMAAKLCKHNILYKSILGSIQKNIFLMEDITVINALHDLMIKLDLLEYIYFRGIKHYNDMDLFNMNIIELCELFVSKSDLDLASICWLKYSKISITTSDDDIMKILNAIPVNIKLGALVVWLRNFLPTLLDENPFNIDLIAKWTSERIFNLEQSPFWPKIGLKYLEAILDVFESSQKTITIRPISIDGLDSLKDHIQYIIELKEKYKINMLISEITSQSPTEVALIMLRRCYTEDLQDLVKDNLCAYANRYQFDLDLTLRSFIEMNAASSGGSVDGQRLEILLNSIHSVSNRLDCFLQVLKFLDVPWDNKIEEIAKSNASLANTDFTLTEADRILAQAIYDELKDAKFKVILKKYNLPPHSYDCISLIHKIVSASTIDLNDLKTVTSYVSPYTRYYANVLYINNCLKECETKAALDFFKTLPRQEKKLLIKSIVTKYEHIISGPRNKLLERNYLDFIKGSHCQDGQINSLEKIYHLKNVYDIRSGLNDICDEEFYTMKLEILKETVNSAQSRCFDRFTTVDLLYVQNKKIEVFLNKISANETVRTIVKQLICTRKGQSFQRDILNQFKHEENIEMLLLSHSVLSDLIWDCTEEFIHELCDLLSMLNTIINTSIIFKNLSVIWKFNYIFLPMSSTSALNNLIDFYVNEETNVGCDGSDFIPLRIITQSFTETLISDKQFSEHLSRMMETVAQKLINKLLASQELDQVILTALLLILHKSPDFVNDKMCILELLQGRSEKYSPSIMYYLSSPVIRLTFGLETVMPSTLTYPPQYVLQSKFNIYLGDIALPDCREETWDVKMLLFYILRQQPDTSVERLTELCQTLNVCINDGLSLLLISVLINWNLQYKISVNDIGCREVGLENYEDDLISKCLTIWQNIENKDFLKDVLKDFWKNGEVVIHGCVISINPYYYEVLLCVYYLLASSFSDNKYLNEYLILNFLKEYQRKGTPKQYEFELFSVKGLFPEIGHYRLPFHLFIRDDMWLNLKSEITLETYERWLPIVGNLSLDADSQTAKDMICSNAVKQTMTNRKPHNSTETDSNDEIWKLTSYEEPLLRAAHRCVRHIANMEWAGACLFYVLQGCARGADQVAAAQLCYQFSQRWAAVQPGNRAVRQMERLHSTLSTRHVLHKIDWACEEFIRLTSEPSQLIHALYLHPNFVEKIGRHNINRAANEIADKNGININSIRIQILENLLDKNKDKQSPSLNNTELITAKYILNVTCPKMGAIYLSRIAIDDENDHNKIKKLRALQCLMSVVDQEIAVKVANKDHQKLWPTLLELFYTVHFERIDMPWVVGSFKQDKKTALSQLIQASGTSVEALKVSAEIAYRYGDLKSIREIIPLLVKTSLHEHLIPLLLKMSCPMDSTVCLAWRAVILDPFQKADYPITERQKAKCLKAINLLPLCPVIKDEDLLEIWKNCIRCKCPALGCLILPYMASETRDKLTELSRVDKRNLIIGLKNLHAESYLVSSAMCVIESMTIKLKR